MSTGTDDLRIGSITELMEPEALIAEMPPLPIVYVREQLPTTQSYNSVVFPMRLLLLSVRLKFRSKTAYVLRILMADPFNTYQVSF